MIKDFCLNTENSTIIDERTSILQQIDMVFDTREDEVFGETYGSDFEQFLWDMKASTRDISEYTESVIYGYVDLKGWELDVKTQFLEGTKNDIILITIKLSKYGSIFEKTYKID